MTASAGRKAKGSLRVVVQGSAVASTGFDLTEGIQLANEDFYLDGPVSRRVAVLAFDPDTGAVVPGVPFTPGKVVGKYPAFTERPKSAAAFSKFVRVNAYGLVLRTMNLYENPDVLGRKVTWGFDGPQLLVLPLAGQDENAFYERESRSLQFFSFPAHNGSGDVHTALSRDIVAHETGHAILDGIAPDLYSALTPQSLALHEAIADITALHLALRSRELVEKVLAASDFELAGSTPFNAIAEEFGRGRGTNGSLRRLDHDKTLDDVSPTSPHELSQVLSGALWSLLCHLYDEDRTRYPPASPSQADRAAAAGKTMGIVAGRFRRITLRGLDHLPPGEVSFADYARVLLEADGAGFPDESAMRTWFAEELVRREVVASADLLDVPAPEPALADLADVDLGLLEDNDWAAYQFVEQRREALAIPADAPFVIRPRRRVHKRVGSKADEKFFDELLVQVSWQHEEDNLRTPGQPPRRTITLGITLVIDVEAKRLRAVLRSSDAKAMREERDGFLQHLVDDGLLKVGPAAFGPMETLRPRTVAAESDGEVLRVLDTARCLHLVGDDDA